jgi:hypothetical protein
MLSFSKVLIEAAGIHGSAGCKSRARVSNLSKLVNLFDNVARSGGIPHRDLILAANIGGR